MLSALKFPGLAGSPPLKLACFTVLTMLFGSPLTRFPSGLPGWGGLGELETAITDSSSSTLIAGLPSSFPKSIENRPHARTPAVSYATTEAAASGTLAASLQANEHRQHRPYPCSSSLAPHEKQIALT